MRMFLTHGKALRRRELVLPAVLFLLCCFDSGTALAGASRDEEDTKVLKVTTQARIDVENTRGRTVIVGRRDTDEVRVRVVKVVRAKDEKTAARWIDELRYTVESDGEKVSVATLHPARIQERWSFWTFIKGIKDKAYIDYTIEVPAAFGASVSTTSGGVSITSLEGAVKISGSSGEVFVKGIGGGVDMELSSGGVEAEAVGGDVSIRMSSGDAAIRDVAGSVTVRGTSGDVEVDRVGGEARIELSSGSVVVRDCRGAVFVRGHSGDIAVLDALGPVKARATSGDVRATFAPVGRMEYTLETSSGDVEAGFHTPTGYGFVLEVDTASGSIEGDLDIRLDEISRKTLKGTVGNGEGRVRIATASGNIRISQKDAKKGD